MIAAAEDLAERQLRDGSASAQVITHYLKLGSSRERLEQEKLSYETELVKAKTEAIAAQQEIKELYVNALKAMRSYSGLEPESTDENMSESDYYEA
jgi:hypothetical protein